MHFFMLLFASGASNFNFKRHFLVFTSDCLSFFISQKLVNLYLDTNCYCRVPVLSLVYYVVS